MRSAAQASRTRRQHHQSIEDYWGGQDGGERVGSGVESETRLRVFARQVGAQQLQLDGERRWLSPLAQIHVYQSENGTVLAVPT
jgi:hypothetical protein